MEKKTKFTCLRYVPLNGNGEAINIAVILHDFVNGKIYFDKIKKHKRLKAFDDNLKLELFKETLRGIEEFLKKPFTKNLFYNTEEKYDENYLLNVSNMFLNDYKMSEIQSVYTENVKETFEDFKNTFLYFDTDKNTRPSRYDAIKTINTLFSSAKHEYDIKSLSKDYHIEGDNTNGEPVTFDYKVGDNYYKIIDLEGQKYSLKYMSAKSWLYNASYLKDNQKLKFILVNRNDSDEAKYIINILNSKNSNIEIIDSNAFLHDIKEEQRKVKNTVQ